jgi:hypothetical protein
MWCMLAKNEIIADDWWMLSHTLAAREISLVGSGPRLAFFPGGIPPNPLGSAGRKQRDHCCDILYEAACLALLTYQVT